MVSSEESRDLPRALVVDDEKEVADAYALRLRGACDVTAVYDGPTALSTVEESAVDVVLLDRHMPGMSGDEVLAELDDREFPGRTIMVTAIDPGFDVLNMPFDDYLCKPVDREDLLTAVDQQVEVLAYETLGEFFGVESKRAVVEAELPAEELREDPDYRAIERRAATLERRARRLLDDPDDVFETFAAVGREGR